ncbi:hypothetical protein DPX16_8216 [Anabarilius grahami]|uniref:Uncharacterized protein n=1 Tax=Anabarilius grahami TaxID=495550 RepID=A0A3N0Y863_ANAGA|nr:hypothetical protein DPX16_8216 [Anabarilius grahami]
MHPETTEKHTESVSFHFCSDSRKTKPNAHLASVHTGLVMEKAPSFSLLLFPSNQQVFAGLSGLQAHLPSQTLQSLDAAVSMCVSLALHQTARFCPESTDGCFNSAQTINVRQIHAESATD